MWQKLIKIAIYIIDETYQKSLNFYYLVLSEQFLSIAKDLNEDNC
tara:strand:- start:462 stop:596 length:135 start_codon:yes stop_codon:yes gene_type:complete